MHPHEGDSTVQILTSSGKSYIIQIENLSDTDQAFVKAAILSEKQSRKTPSNTPKSSPAADSRTKPTEHSIREWRITGQPSFRGRYTETSEDGRLIRITDPQGELRTVEIRRLHEDDRKYLTDLRASEIDASEADRADGRGIFAGFKPVPAMNREQIPVISQGDFGSKASDCVPSSLCNFLLWWDKEGYLKIPKRGDFHDKADWVHTRVARYCGTRNNSGTYTDDATKGFRKYFTKDIEDLATLNIHIDHDIQPENLARYTMGDQATMLGMTIRQRPSRDSGHWVALLDAKPDGSIIFNTWGAQFRGKIVPLEKSEEKIRRQGQTVSATTYRIEITNQDDLPDWFRNSERELILNPENWDYLYILRPYVYAEEGKAVPTPSDPMMQAK